MKKLLLIILISFQWTAALPALIQEVERAKPADKNSNYISDFDSGNSASVPHEYEKDLSSENDIYSLRKPSDNFLDQYKNQEEFNYNTVETPVGFFEKVGAWINDKFREVLLSKGFYYFEKYLGYIIALLAIVIVIYIINKSKLGGIFYSRRENRLNNIKESSEDITRINLDELFSDAVNKGNYRAAIRYNYLKILKLLSEKKFIDWKINKTNYDYLVELQENNLKKYFADLTYLFEWIWYGEIPVEEELFKESVKIFNNFESLLPEKR